MEEMPSSEAVRDAVERLPWRLPADGMPPH
jgi:hypothetical protein